MVPQEMGSMRTSRETKFSVNLFWTALIFIGFYIIVFLGSFLAFYSFWYALGIAVAMSGIAILLTIVGAKLHREQKLVEKEDTTKYRKLFNVAGGIVMASICWFFGPWFVFFVMAAFTYAYGLHEIVLCKLNTPIWFSDALAALGRQAEAENKMFLQPLSALVSFMIIIFLPSFLFYPLGTQAAKALVVIIFFIATIAWGIGDSLAYYFGTKYGKHKLPWNKQKSMEGSLAMAIFGIVLCFILLSPAIFNLFGFLTSFISELWYVLISIVTGFIAALIESLKLPLDDNFTTPTFTAIFLTLLIYLAI
ncbi:MAG: hypothetical protein ACTSRS_07090 [Candidatus Helarchaeota archaeon]